MNLLTNKKALSVIALAAAAAIAAGGLSMRAHASIKVNTHTTGSGSIAKITEINGNVISDRSESLYAEIDGRIARILVREGDYVKKGDLLVSYDTKEIDRLIALADLSAQEKEGSFDNVIQTGGRYAGLYSEAAGSLAVLEQQITDTQAAIDLTRQKITQKEASIADFGAKLQVSLIDWSDDPTSEEYENLSKMVAENAYDQQYNPELISLREQLTTLNTQLASYKETKAQMVSQKASSTAGLVTKGTKDQIEAARAVNELSTQTTIADHEKAKEGVKAGFDGIVTSIGVTENSFVGKGTFLLTVESVKDVVIRMNVNKYDIMDLEVGQTAETTIRNKEYTGHISRIEHMTENDGTSNVGVEVTLDDPDENIILGLETKVRINSAAIDNTLIVPLDALCEDEEGTYVFTLRDQKAAKCFVETGIRNDDDVEILSGISENDIVIWNDETELTDGMDVRLNK